MTQLYRKTSSQHVLDITEIYEDGTSFYIITPKCNGGNLFAYLWEKDQMPESECQRIMRDILKGLGDLHENHLLHRDLKPENVLLQRSGSAYTLKLCDLDTCVKWSPQTPR